MNDDDYSKMTTRTSERFDAPDSDITLRSCDAVLFKVHRINLKMHSDIFADAEDISSSSSSSSSSSATITPSPPPDAQSSSSSPSSTTAKTQLSPNYSKQTNEQVQLSEPSAVLSILLQYMYRQPPPDLYQLEFDTLAQVAEAAEKYRVFFAIDGCKRAMRDAIPSYPFEVLNWAVKHKHTVLIDEAAEYTIRMSSDNMKEALAPSIQGAWITYHKHFLDTLNAQYAHYAPTASHWNSSTRDVDLPCEAWTYAYALVAHSLGARPWMMLPERRRGASPWCPNVGSASSSSFGGPANDNTAAGDTNSNSHSHNNSSSTSPPGNEVGITHLFAKPDEYLKSKCGECRETLAIWRKEMERDIERIPRFSSLI